MITIDTATASIAGFERLAVQGLEFAGTTERDWEVIATAPFAAASCQVAATRRPTGRMALTAAAASVSASTSW